MKKNFLLVLLSSLTLASCDFSIEQLKFWEKTSDNTQQEGEKESTDQDGHQDADPGTDPQVDPGTPPQGTYVHKISLSGSEFSSITSGERGYQFDDEEFSSHVQDLQKYCASKLDATNMLTSINCIKCNTAPYNNVFYFCVGTGYYGSNKFNEGSFKWTSVLPIHKIEIKAMAYSKLDDGGSTDGQSVVWINDESHSLAQETTVAPTMQTFSKDFPKGVESFEIKSTGSRVLLESITITWDFLYEAN